MILEIKIIEMSLDMKFECWFVVCIVGFIFKVLVVEKLEGGYS